MGTAIGDVLRYYRNVTVPKQVAEFECRLVPVEEGSLDLQHSERVAAEVFSRTGLPPSEYKRLDPGGKLVWLEKALDEAPPPDDDDPLLEQVLDTLTGQGSKIVAELWKKKSRSMGFDSIVTIPGAFRSPSDEALLQALKRVRNCLNANDHLGVVLEVSTTKRRAKIVLLAGQFKDK